MVNFFFPTVNIKTALISPCQSAPLPCQVAPLDGLVDVAVTDRPPQAWLITDPK